MCWRFERAATVGGMTGDDVSMRLHAGRVYNIFQASLGSYCWSIYASSHALRRIHCSDGYHKVQFVVGTPFT